MVGGGEGARGRNVTVTDRRRRDSVGHNTTSSGLPKHPDALDGPRGAQLEAGIGESDNSVIEGGRWAELLCSLLSRPTLGRVPKQKL